MQTTASYEAQMLLILLSNPNAQGASEAAWKYVVQLLSNEAK